MVFCFSTYASVLARCMLPRVKQTLLISKIISSVDKQHGEELSTDSITASNYTRGTKNISPRVEVYTKECNAAELADYFRENVIPLLDQNKSANIVLAIKDIISKDDVIKPSTIVEHVSKLTKKQLLGKDDICLDRFLAGLFLYVMVNTNNKDGRNDTKLITDEYIHSFDTATSNIHMESNGGNVLLQKDEIPHSSEYGIDEDTLEKARLFCFDHEEDLHLLPLSEMASILHPEHKHINPFINDFLRQNKKTQKAILISKSIKPYELCSEVEIDKCVDAFEKEIKEKKLATIEFLYEGAKYFHRAFTYHADYKPESIDPFIFRRHYVNSSLFPNVPGNLSSYIDDYLYGLEHHPEEEMTPPFNLLWYGFDLANCEEKTLVFWVNRFIITVCHYFHCFNPDAQYDESWQYKDTIEDYKLKTMEDMYYYALLLLYMSYGPEREEITDA